MLKLLLSLRYIQWRRNFSWRKFLVVLYLVGIMLFMIVGLLFASSDMLADLLDELPPAGLAIALVAMLALPDFMLKMMWNTDAVVMDDFLRTKPIPSNAWNRFMAISLMVDPWNLVIPMLAALVGSFLLPVGVTVLAVVAALVQSLMLSWLVADIHKAPDIEHSLPLWIGGVVYYLGMTTVGSILIMMAMMFHLPGSPWTELVLFIVLDIVLTVVLYLYFCRMRAYDEHEQHASNIRSVGDVTLFSTEYLSVLRSKRLRVPILIFTVLFLLQSYTLPSDGVNQLNIPLYFLLGWPSLFLGQWVFGIEGNYFHGLWTKPYSIEHMLLNKYKFFIILTLSMAVLLIPAIFLMGLRPTTLLAMILFLGCGHNLLMMPTCLFSTRLDLFTSSFFNYQGASMRVTIYSFIILIPLAIFAFCSLALVPFWGDTIMAAIGLAALAVHRPCIRLLAQKWKNNRYENMERYLN